MSDLKPCPFCGGRPIWEYCTEDRLDIRCDTCGITFEEGFRNRAEAIEAWNRRTERTANAEYSEPDGCYLCGECGYVIEIEDVYCAGCGARLDWSE